MVVVYLKAELEVGFSRRAKGKDLEEEPELVVDGVSLPRPLFLTIF